MQTFFKQARLLFSREKRHLLTLSEFGHANPDLLIIVCDPKTDRMYSMYRNRFANAKVRSTTGKNTHVVRDVLKYSQFDKNIDGFMGALVDFLKLPVLKGNQFYQVIDGCLLAIAKSLLKKRQAPEPIKSPFVGDEIINKQK